MADVSKRGTNPWIAFLAGAVAVLAVVLVLFGWRGGQRLADGFALSLRDAPDLPTLPHTPVGPLIPTPRVPTPQ